jgi:hypothetical protein
MKVLRLLFLLAVIASATLTAARAPWQARLLVGMTAFIIDLDRAPIWSPPKGPTYDQFRRTFPNDGSAHDNIPPARTPGLVIRPVLKWD